MNGWINRMNVQIDRMIHILMNVNHCQVHRILLQPGILTQKPCNTSINNCFQRALQKVSALIRMP